LKKTKTSKRSKQQKAAPSKPQKETAKAPQCGERGVKQALDALHTELWNIEGPLLDIKDLVEEIAEAARAIVRRLRETDAALNEEVHVPTKNEVRYMSTEELYQMATKLNLDTSLGRASLQNAICKDLGL
jgi:hypothetical protein